MLFFFFLKVRNLSLIGAGCNVVIPVPTRMVDTPQENSEDCQVSKISWDYVYIYLMFNLFSIQRKKMPCVFFSHHYKEHPAHTSLCVLKIVCDVHELSTWSFVLDNPVIRDFEWESNQLAMLEAGRQAVAYFLCFKPTILITLLSYNPCNWRFCGFDPLAKEDKLQPKMLFTQGYFKCSCFSRSVPVEWEWKAQMTEYYQIAYCFSKDITIHLSMWDTTVPYTHQ